MTSMPEGGKALLVDDDPFVLKLLSRQLTLLGFSSILVFERAADVVALLENSQDWPDLILTDLRMPEMDGIEFVRHLVRTGYNRALLLVSGEDRRMLLSVQRLAELYGLREVGVLQKPASSVQIRSRVLELVTPAEPAVREDPRFELNADQLRTAFSEGAVVTHFQPKVNLADGSMQGVEALARWRHSQHGVLAAARFIGLVEAQGLSALLTRTVLDTALMQCRQWQDDGLEVQVAVNLSALCLGSLDLLEIVERAAGGAGIALSRLTLELTESHLIAEPAIALEVLTRLRLKGVSLSIDQFGNGHSSLAKLRDFPFEELKLGPDFVQGMRSDAVNAAIVDATLAMARQLGINTVAEGVASIHDWQYLRERGCTMAQSYFIGEPMPGPALPAWMDAWEGRRPAFLAAGAP